MILTRHATQNGPRWAVDGQFLAPSFSLGLLLELPADAMAGFLSRSTLREAAAGELTAPLDRHHEVWASGVTYLRSRDARQAESTTGDIYARVYNAERPELFFKAAGWRVIGPGGQIRVRPDSRWDVPEPELTLIINRDMEVVGYTAGNDVSSRSIEGENPLYLPQAKVYNGSCALGPAIELAGPGAMRGLEIRLEISREGRVMFSGETNTTQIKRDFEELAAYLGKELAFPQGVLLMTGTGIVPPDSFTLKPGDEVRVVVGGLVLENRVGK